jgi:LacI family transcriptional regulator
MSVSMRSIAREVGVSPTLVSQLFRGDPRLRISDERRREILAARDRLGGVKMRPSKLSHTIVAPLGWAAPQAYIDRNMRGNPIHSNFERIMGERGYHVEFQHIPEDVVCERLRQWLRRPKHPDGLLILWNYCTPELADLLRTYAFPHVTDDFKREHLQINSVCHHATGGMRQAVEHLASLGHRHIAFVGAKRFFRYSMMVSAMVELDLPIDSSANCWLEPVAYPENYDEIRHHANEAFDEWFARRGDVTALVCSNDYCALGVIDAMRRRGLVAGEDLSVVGFDNIEPRDPSTRRHPILTTIDNPFERIGQRMAELLLNQIEQGQNQIVHERLPSSLIVRRTTGPVAGVSHRKRRLS